MFQTSKVHLVNSRNKISGEHGNFTYKFNESLDKYDRVCIVSASIPKSYYGIQTGLNDTFTLTEGVTSYTITLTAGNYTAVNMASHLQTKLNTGHSNTYTCTYPTTVYDTAKFTFTSTGAASFTFASTRSACEIMGFDAGSTNSFSGGSLTSTNVINLNKETTLRIISNMTSDGALCNMIASNTPDFNVIQYNCIDILALSKKLTHSNTNTYSFSITNESDEVLNLNGLNVVIELLFYKDEFVNIIDASRMIKGFIKYNLIQN